MDNLGRSSLFLHKSDPKEIIQNESRLRNFSFYDLTVGSHSFLNVKSSPVRASNFFFWASQGLLFAE